jgi:2'-5' RNA ligase
MYTIVSPVPDNFTTAIEPYRQKFDPLARLAPPHITLLEPFQFSATPDTLYTHLSEVGEVHAPVKIFLIGWHVYEGKEYQIHLPMTAGVQPLTKLRHDILSGPLSSLASAERTYQPHVTLGRFVAQTDLEQAKQILKGFEPQFVFRVSHLELWQREEAGQPWRVEMKFALKATLAGRNRRATGDNAA